MASQPLLRKLPNLGFKPPKNLTKMGENKHYAAKLVKW